MDNAINKSKFVFKVDAMIDRLNDSMKLYDNDPLKYVHGEAIINYLNYRSKKEMLELIKAMIETGDYNY